MLLGDYLPSQTPAFTLFGDGYYVRIAARYDVEADRYHVERMEGALGDAERAELVRRLAEDAGFFDLPASPPGMTCATDGPTDYLYLSDGEREHRISVYGLTSYLPERRPCPTPWAPDERLVALAEIVSAFREPLTEDETPFVVERITLAASDRDLWEDDEPEPAWPFGSTIRLADMPGDGWSRAMQVFGAPAAEIVQAIEANAYSGTNVARFVDEGVKYIVGARVEFARWDAYR